MSMTPDEAAYEEYMDKLYEEHRKEAIEEFTDERLQSYYIDNKLLAKPSVDALSDAKKLINTNNTASFIFATIAIEVGLKTTLLKPIVYGLVHTESVATLITDLTLSSLSMDRYRKLLLKVLQDHGGVDLDSFKRAGSSKPLWEEIKEVQKLRNDVMHRAEIVLKEKAEQALGIASEILETIFPTVITKMGLHLHDGFKICNDWKCKYNGTEIEDVVKDT